MQVDVVGMSNVAGDGYQRTVSFEFLVAISIYTG